MTAALLQSYPALLEGFTFKDNQTDLVCALMNAFD